MSCFSVAFCSLFTLTAWHRDIASGPKAGDKVEGFDLQATTGPFAAKKVDYVKEQKEKLTVYLFVSQEHFDRPTYRFLKKLDAELAKKDTAPTVVAIWLAEKAEESKDYLKRAEGSLSFQKLALGYFEGKKEGPNGWGINTDAHLTVVLVKAGKGVQNFAFQSIAESDAAKIVEAVEKHAK